MTRRIITKLLEVSDEIYMVEDDTGAKKYRFGEALYDVWCSRGNTNLS